jgi:hypothetical protein
MFAFSWRKVAVGFVAVGLVAAMSPLGDLGATAVDAAKIDKSELRSAIHSSFAKNLGVSESSLSQAVKSSFSGASKSSSSSSGDSRTAQFVSKLADNLNVSEDKLFSSFRKTLESLLNGNLSVSGLSKQSSTSTSLILNKYDDFVDRIKKKL